MKDRIIELLSAGVNQVAVSAATGVSESYVSQIASENSEKIAAARAEKAGKFVQHDATLDALEDRTLQKLGRVLDTVTDPMKVVGIFKVLNGAQRKSEAAVQQQTPSTVVNIELPAIARVAIKVAGANQVVEVAGRSMLTMQAKTVEELLAARKNTQAENLRLLQDTTHLEDLIPVGSNSLLSRL